MASLKLFVLLGLVALSFAFPVPTNKEVKELYELLPEECRKFYQELTEADLQVFHELKPQLKGKSDEESYAVIASKSKNLADRTKEMYEKLFSKIETLSAKPKKYMTELVNKIENIDATTVEAWLEKVDEEVYSLGKPEQAVQDEIVKAFPTLKEFWSEM
ncbi:hypothetical protein L596_023300 [Steinernema carpocapsae]|uniref:Fatty-acid and retinol-binding protein 1 n=1 Tax=Steinernema carpocapsae TaxID=34508 RepID=A0A4U5MD76_STECR|nr:hypothetical protein L596_023300 [Steinernema carpocapsae]